MMTSIVYHALYSTGSRGDLFVVRTSKPVENLRLSVWEKKAREGKGKAGAFRSRSAYSVIIPKFWLIHQRCRQNHNLNYYILNKIWCLRLGDGMHKLLIECKSTLWNAMRKLLWKQNGSTTFENKKKMTDSRFPLSDKIVVD